MGLLPLTFRYIYGSHSTDPYLTTGLVGDSFEHLPRITLCRRATMRLTTLSYHPKYNTFLFKTPAMPISAPYCLAY